MSPDARHDGTQGGLIVLIPIFNDWQAVTLLIADLDGVLGEAGLRARVLLVDDGSTTPPPETLATPPMDAIDGVQLLSLRRNVGHQRAIAIGLSHIEAKESCRAVVVMDGDGEDAPRDVPTLVARMAESGDQKIVFAARARRSESTLFRVCYFLYRRIHLLLTGISVRVGNFSVVPRVQLRRLVIVSDLWNHFSAAIHRAKLPFDTVPCERAKRLAGPPQMNFVSLVGHGLSAMSVFGDLIGARMLIASSLMVLSSLAAIAGIGIFVGATSANMAGWEPYLAGFLFFILLQGLLFSFVFVFIILASRNMSGFIPARDYELFVEDLRDLVGHE